MICTHEIIVHFQMEEYSARIAVESHVDSRYGEDSDYRGGYPRRFIDEVQIDSIFDENGVEVTRPYHPDLIEAIEEEANEKC